MSSPALVPARNRIVPLIVFAIWLVCSTTWLNRHDILTTPVVLWFVVALAGLIVGVSVICARSRKGNYDDGDVLGVLTALGVLWMVHVFGNDHIISIRDLGIVFAVTLALGFWVIKGLKPSRTYTRLVEYSERRAERAKDNRHSDGLDSLFGEPDATKEFAATSDDHDPQPA